jgi:D-alanyl-D-alanine carboxypeptidase
VFNINSDRAFRAKYFTEDGFYAHRFDRMTPEQLLAIAMAHRPDFAPGASWNYSNTNYLLAALVIEKATGRPYEKEIRDRIIEPLHLTGTSVPVTRPTLPQPSSRAYSKLAETATGPTYDVTELNPSAAPCSRPSSSRR